MQTGASQMAKRNKKDFLPKRVGRIKIPKRIRRGVVGAAIGSAAGQAVIAALILNAGARLADRVAAAQDSWDEAEGLLGGADQSAGDPTAPDGQEAEGVTTAPARTGPRLNVKHALGQAALAFVVGLAYPKPPKRRSRRSPGHSAAANPGPNGAGLPSPH